jgi:hypothetical protein
VPQLDIVIQAPVIFFYLFLVYIILFYFRIRSWSFFFWKGLPLKVLETLNSKGSLTLFTIIFYEFFLIRYFLLSLLQKDNAFTLEQISK